ncbi:transcription factor bHLH143 [Sesamum indicum]|uniref:Transcription factor bHLH143 n=1 Tax=Sesamum indicum TaxID=4182 RepID=A0A6I9T1V0_SESIN|nr:transcription factor bHLH143 [Sesamum indicum]
MEKDCGIGIHQHSMPAPSPNLNSLGFCINSGHLNADPVCTNPYLVEDSTLRTIPLFPVSGLQELKASQPNDSGNWLYRMPYFHQAFAPAFQEKFPVGRFEFRQEKSPTIGTAPGQKRFLVFDQSGDKTTLVYSSAVQTPVQHGARWVLNPPTTYNSNKEELRNSINPLRSSVKDENMEDNSRDVTEDEMHEDTEELDALLCSDNDSDFSENDEETSTGHSPSTMTDNGIDDLVKETGEEVDSFLGPTKRQKLLDGGYNAPSKRKNSACYAFEDDAESSCGNGNKQLKEKLGSSSGCKRSRKEKIRETISILQSIIPSGNGKNAIVVIDEAIHYLRSLKVKAKALGLDSL